MMAGRLRHRLAIQDFTEERQPSGQMKKTWNTVRTVWGSVEPMKGSELFQAQQVCPRVTHKITIRGGRSLAPIQRAMFKGRFLNIEYVTDLREQGITTIAYATEVPSNAAPVDV